VEHLDKLESQSVYIIREAYRQFRNIGMLWSIGKDSTTLLYLLRKAFYGKVPFPVIHIDTGFKFKEIYNFRNEWVQNWNLDMIVGKNEQALARGMKPCAGNKSDCCGQLKTEALKQVLEKYRFTAILVGIRRDEHGIRAKERIFSPRDDRFRWDYKNQPAELWDQYKSRQGKNEHIRVHPLLHWTEYDIWTYIRREKIPVVGLYFARDGKRYRSIGCETCCDPTPSQADTIDGIVEELRNTKIAERSGRAQDKETAYMMQKLRSLGYM
jgi:sulfate adenylyltransferase subunit 2